MSLTVFTRDPTTAGRLYPRYDDESGLLVVESTVRRAWSYGINIDSLLILDIDVHSVLANFDLHITKRLWVAIDDLSWPRAVRDADLLFTVTSLNQRYFELPVTVCCNRATDLVRIEIGKHAAVEAVRLSDDCVALLAGDILAGFCARRF